MNNEQRDQVGNSYVTLYFGIEGVGRQHLPKFDVISFA